MTAHEFLRRRKFAILLLSLILVQLLPVLSGSPNRRLTGLSWGLVLAAAVHAASGRRRFTLLFSVIALAGFSGRMGTIFDAAGAYQRSFDAGGYVASAVFLLMAIWVVFRELADRAEVNVETVRGAISVYLMIGMLWANFYALVAIVEPGSFDFPAHAQLEASSDIPEFAFGYYSFVTLTTLGYGDVTPLTFRARTLSWMEAVVGVVYMATVIGFLVSQLLAERNIRRKPR